MIKVLKILIFISLLTSCVTTQDENTTKNSDSKKDYPPIWIMETYNGTVFAVNKGDTYFISYLPGNNLELKAIEGNLVIIFDNQIYQFNIIDLKEESIINAPKKDILMEARDYEANYIRTNIDSNIDFLNNNYFEMDKLNQSFLFWGYKQKVKSKTITQLYLTLLGNKPYILGLNSPVSEPKEIKIVKRNMNLILGNTVFYDTPITEKELQDYYDSKF